MLDDRSDLLDWKLRGLRHTFMDALQLLNFRFVVLCKYKVNLNVLNDYTVKQERPIEQEQLE